MSGSVGVNTTDSLVSLTNVTAKNVEVTDGAENGVLYDDSDGAAKNVKMVANERRGITPYSIIEL